MNFRIINKREYSNGYRAATNSTDTGAMIERADIRGADKSWYVGAFAFIVGADKFDAEHLAEWGFVADAEALADAEAEAEMVELHDSLAEAEVEDEDEVEVAGRSTEAIDRGRVNVWNGRVNVGQPMPKRASKRLTLTESRAIADRLGAERQRTLTEWTPEPRRVVGPTPSHKLADASLVRSDNVRPTFGAEADYSLGQMHDGLAEIVAPMTTVVRDAFTDWQDDSVEHRAASVRTETISWATDDKRRLGVELVAPLDGIGSTWMADESKSADKRNRASVRQAIGGTGAKMTPQVPRGLVAMGVEEVRFEAVRNATPDRSMIRVLTLAPSPTWKTFGDTRLDRRSFGPSSASLAIFGEFYCGRTVGQQRFARPTTFDLFASVGESLTKSGKVDKRKGRKSDAGKPRRSQKRAKAERSTEAKHSTVATMVPTSGIEIDETVAFGA